VRNDPPIRRADDLAHANVRGCSSFGSDGDEPDALAVGLYSADPPEMRGLRELWQNGTKRLLIVLIVISTVIMLLAGGVAIGIFVLDGRVRKIASNQTDISAQVLENTDAIDDFQKAVNQGWQSYQDANPTQPVPQIVETEAKDESKSEVVIKPPLEVPKPSPAAPTPIVKQRKVIEYRYRSRPTPTPWTLFPRPAKRK